MPGDQDNPNAAVAAQPAPEAAAPGKLRVDQMTLDRFSEDQVSALQQANMERTTRGLPQWVVADYVRVHINRFPNVDYELDEREAIERNKAAPALSASQRVDQRPAG